MSDTKTNETFALKYRPKKLEDLAGHKQIISGIRGMLKAKDVPNAFLLVGPSGVGKCVTGDTVIYTNRGLQPIKNLIDTEGYHEYNGSLQLLNGFGNWEKPAFTFKRKSKTMKVVLADGRHLTGTPEHPVLCVLPNGDMDWVKLENLTGDELVILTGSDLHSDTYVKTQYQSKAFNANRAPLKPFPKPSEVNEDVGFILGALVAEGSLTQGDRTLFNNKNKKFLRLYQEAWKRLDPNIELVYQKGRTCSSISIKNGYNYGSYLKCCGLIYDVSAKQRVPHVIFNSPKSVKSAFLRAYFEGDGGWGSYEKGNAELCAYSASKKLLLGIQLLLQTFGIHSFILKPKRVLTQRKNALYYTLKVDSPCLATFMSEIGFVSKRKKSIWDPDKYRNANTKWLPEQIMEKWYRLVKALPGSSNGVYTDYLDNKVVGLTMIGDRIFNKNYIANRLQELGDYRYRFTNEISDLFKDIEYLLQINAKCVPIKSISKGKEKWVYDFTLPRTHSFIANGIVNHNTTISRMLARYLNCETMDACGKCESCKAMDDLSSMDYTEVNGSESGNIDTIRKLIESASFRPRGRFRIIMLDEIHRISAPAANALLKPLEEPPEHTLWILATTDPDKIPNSKAVCGRCTQLILNKPTREEIAERLTSIAKDAKLKWVKEKYALDIAEASGGHVRDAVQILQAVNTAIRGHDGKPSKKEIKQMVSDLSVKTVDLDTEKTTLNILIGIYSNDPKRLQRAILDAEDYTQIINKVLMLNYYLLNKLLIGKHEKIWETKVNRALFNYLSDNGMPSPELVALVHKSLTQLKSEMASYVVNGEHLLTAHLMGYCNEQKTEKSKIKNKKRKSKD